MVITRQGHGSEFPFHTLQAGPLTVSHLHGKSGQDMESPIMTPANGLTGSLEKALEEDRSGKRLLHENKCGYQGTSLPFLSVCEGRSPCRNHQLMLEKGDSGFNIRRIARERESVVKQFYISQLFTGSCCSPVGAQRMPLNVCQGFRQSELLKFGSV